MSCGEHHDLDCAQALDHLYEYLDDEPCEIEAATIAQHLQECGPCLAEYDVERIVKVIVARSCCQSAPQTLRARVVAELVSTRIRITGPSASANPQS